MGGRFELSNTWEASRRSVIRDVGTMGKELGVEEVEIDQFEGGH
jgi:hypothetical protein